jgi:hypothetical protein
MLTRPRWRAPMTAILTIFFRQRSRIQANTTRETPDRISRKLMQEQF